MKRARRGLSSSTERRARDRHVDHYEVGYGKPPKHGRFKPGGCGNPNGRPRGVCNIETDVRNTLRAPVKVTINGRQRKVSTQEAIILRLREKALAGDRHAIDRMLQFAQAYNPEGLAAATAALTAEDINVLAVYQARVMSGAARAIEPGDAENKTTGSPPAEPVPPTSSVEQATIERVQMKRRRASDHESIANDPDKDE
jgi:Family of unknown function (DUF5681)